MYCQRAGNGVRTREAWLAGPVRASTSIARVGLIAVVEVDCAGMVSIPGAQDTQMVPECALASGLGKSATLTSVKRVAELATVISTGAALARLRQGSLVRVVAGGRPAGVGRPVIAASIAAAALAAVGVPDLLLSRAFSFCILFKSRLRAL